MEFQLQLLEHSVFSVASVHTAFVAKHSIKRPLKTSRTAEWLIHDIRLNDAPLTLQMRIYEHSIRGCEC